MKINKPIPHALSGLIEIMEEAAKDSSPELAELLRAAISKMQYQDERYRRLSRLVWGSENGPGLLDFKPSGRADDPQQT